MNDFLKFMGPAALASAVMSPVHSLFGIHIVRRGVIFIDLAVAQVAALGMAIAIASGHEPTTTAAYFYALAFGLGAAFLIALTRFRLGRVPHEAIIGIIFVVASALAIIVLDQTPHGLEELQNLTRGSILLVNPAEVRETAIIYGVILVITLLIWRQTTAITLQQPDAPQGVRAMLFDFLFYSLLAFVVASSVKVAGVLLVFTWLVMPAVAALFFVERITASAFLTVPIAIFGSLLGLWVSYVKDWVSGAAIVVVFGVTVAVFYVIKLFLPSSRSESTEPSAGPP